MIALQILLLISSVYGFWISLLNLRHSQASYADWRAGGENGLALQVASHHVRIAVSNTVIESSQLIIALITVAVMWSQRFDLDLTLVMFTGLVTASILNFTKQLMYRYDRALVIDVATAKREKAEEIKNTLAAEKAPRLSGRRVGDLESAGNKG